MTATAPCTSASKLLSSVGVVTPSLPNPSGFLHSLILTSLAADLGLEPKSGASETPVLPITLIGYIKRGRSPLTYYTY